MTRRHAILAAVLLSLSGIAGCPQKDTLATLTNTLGTAAAKIATLQGNQQLADKLRHDTDVAVTALRSWQPGQSAAETIRAVNQLIDTLKLFPVNDQFRPLISFALGTAAAIIDFINSQGGAGDRPHTDIRLTQAPRTDKEFRDDWDAIRRASPGLEKAPVL